MRNQMIVGNRTAFAIPSMFSLRLLSAAAFANTVLLPAPAVMKRLGVTAMTLHRWLNGNRDRKSGRSTPPLSDFPRPVIINKRRYWSEDEIERFISARKPAISPGDYPEAETAPINAH